MTSSTPTPQFSVILPAGGNSTRFGSDKLSADLVGLPVIARAVGLFIDRDDVLEIIIATSRQDELRPLIESAFSSCKERVWWTAGGPSRAETVQFGLELAHGNYIAVHDAARPCTPRDCIDRVFKAALMDDAAAPALPVKLTIKQALGPLPAKVIRTLPRHELFEMQTPQAMSARLLREGYARIKQLGMPLEQITDDAQLIEFAGGGVTLVAGDERNLKITTRAELHAAHEHFNAR